MASYKTEMKYFDTMINDIFDYYYERRKLKVSSLIFYNNWIAQTRFQPLDDEMSSTAVEYFQTLVQMSEPLLDILRVL